MGESGARMKSMLNTLKNQFFAGLIIFVPLSLTIYFSYLLYVLISSTLHPILVTFIHVPPAFSRPISFAITLLLIWGMGIVASNFAGKRLVSWMDWMIHQIPVFRGFYEAIQKMTEAFFGSNNIYQSAVLVRYPRYETFTIAFVTGSFPGEQFQSTEPHYCVFIPTVPNPTSGILLYVPQSETIPLDLTIEEVAKIIVSHGFVPLNKNKL